MHNMTYMPVCGVKEVPRAEGLVLGRECSLQLHLSGCISNDMEFYCFYRFPFRVFITHAADL